MPVLAKDRPEAEGKMVSELKMSSADVRDFFTNVDANLHWSYMQWYAYPKGTPGNEWTKYHNPDNPRPNQKGIEVIPLWSELETGAISMASTINKLAPKYRESTILYMQKKYNEKSKRDYFGMMLLVNSYIGAIKSKDVKNTMVYMNWVRDGVISLVEDLIGRDIGWNTGAFKQIYFPADFVEFDPQQPSEPLEIRVAKLEQELLKLKRIVETLPNLNNANVKGTFSLID